MGFRGSSEALFVFLGRRCCDLRERKRGGGFLEFLFNIVGGFFMGNMSGRPLHTDTEE